MEYSTLISQFHSRRRSDFVDDILECTLVRPKPPVLAGVNPRRGLAVAGGSQQHKGGGTARSRAGTSRPLRGEGDEEWHRSMPFIQSVDNKQVEDFLPLKYYEPSLDLQESSLKENNIGPAVLESLSYRQTEIQIDICLCNLYLHSYDIVWVHSLYKLVVKYRSL